MATKKVDRGELEERARDRAECERCVYRDMGCICCEKMALAWAWYYLCLEIPIIRRLASVPQPCYLREELENG